ncbi:MAG: tetratricopeptide repeat protein [Minicystis sp.]
MPRTRPGQSLAARLAIVAACHAAVLGGPAGAALAQGGKSVTTTLIQRGAALFDDQQYEESIQTLSAALVRPGASDKEKIETYRLLAYNFIILKRADEADAAVRGIFVIDEGFTLPPSESPRFREFFANTKKKWVDEGKPGKGAVGNAAAMEKPIRMTHTSPPQVPAGSAIKLTGTIEDPDGRVRGVQLAYRTGAKGKFVTVAASYTLGEFRATIPAQSVKPPLVEYYLIGVDKGGLPLTSRGDAATPLRMVVPNEFRALTSPALWIPVGVAVVGGAVATAILLTRSKGTSTVTVGVRE